MPTLSLEALARYRTGTFRLKKRLTSKEDAVEFVNERGFIYFWPIREITLPSLWTAAAGDRPVADAHDDPGHITWGWKDSLLGKKAWYYAKVLRKKATIISLQAAPYFYALTENYGSPAEDYLTIYEQGRLTLEAKQVYEVLLDKGPLDTVTLRKAAHLTSNGSETRFNRALSDLQADFKILPVGVTEAGAWHYAFSYDIVPRHYPELLEQARYIGELDACRKLAELYLRSVGAAQLRDITRLFGWKPELARKVLEHWQQKGLLQGGLTLEKHPGEWFALVEILE
ncbi:MAG TPA: crosslink repair DNA glycosylase YcaQ family protein [Anaerolineales bacterium]|nr:crosslink repair DNA glycosylase YcaQ family protein [Anaerolineales bacterium]